MTWCQAAVIVGVVLGAFLAGMALATAAYAADLGLQHKHRE